MSTPITWNNVASTNVGANVAALQELAGKQLNTGAGAITDIMNRYNTNLENRNTQAALAQITGATTVEEAQRMQDNRAGIVAPYGADINLDKFNAALDARSGQLYARQNQEYQAKAAGYADTAAQRAAEEATYQTGQRNIANANAPIVNQLMRELHRNTTATSGVIDFSSNKDFQGLSSENQLRIQIAAEVQAKTKRDEANADLLRNSQMQASNMNAAAQAQSLKASKFALDENVKSAVDKQIAADTTRGLANNVYLEGTHSDGATSQVVDDFAARRSKLGGKMNEDDAQKLSETINNRLKQATKDGIPIPASVIKAVLSETGTDGTYWGDIRDSALADKFQERMNIYMRENGPAIKKDYGIYKNIKDQEAVLRNLETRRYNDKADSAADAKDKASLLELTTKLKELRKGSAAETTIKPSSLNPNTVKQYTKSK